jgi:hypothetical protein
MTVLRYYLKYLDRMDSIDEVFFWRAFLLLLCRLLTVKNSGRIAPPVPVNYLCSAFNCFS